MCIWIYEHPNTAHTNMLFKCFTDMNQIKQLISPCALKPVCFISTWSGIFLRRNFPQRSWMANVQGVHGSSGPGQVWSCFYILSLIVFFKSSQTLPHIPWMCQQMERQECLCAGKAGPGVPTQLFPVGKWGDKSREQHWSLSKLLFLQSRGNVIWLRGSPISALKEMGNKLM